MSGRLNRLNDALTNSGIHLIETVEPIAEAVNEAAYGVKAGATSFRNGAEGMSFWTKDWRDAQEELSSVRKLERATAFEERLDIAKLNAEAHAAKREATKS
jgi:hypothetical protein